MTHSNISTGTFSVGEVVLLQRLHMHMSIHIRMYMSMRIMVKKAVVGFAVAHIMQVMCVVMRVKRMMRMMRRRMKRRKNCT